MSDNWWVVLVLLIAFVATGGLVFGVIWDFTHESAQEIEYRRADLRLEIREALDDGIIDKSFFDEFTKGDK